MKLKVFVFHSQKSFGFPRASHGFCLQRDVFVENVVTSVCFPTRNLGRGEQWPYECPKALGGGFVKNTTLAGNGLCTFSGGILAAE